MELRAKINTIIINGKWNKRIFTPEWINKFLLPEEKNLIIDVILDDEVAMKVSSKSIGIQTTDARLCIINYGITDEIYQQVEEVVFKIADYLPHTPVKTFGVNFAYSTEINEAVLALIKTQYSQIIKDNEYPVSKEYFRYNFQYDEQDINMIISVDYTKNKIDYNVNFNYIIKTLTDVKTHLDSYGILKCKKAAIKIVNQIYNE
ncbi:MAG: hypothetical protein KBA11_08315 [Sedimentibacter sp.]|nr:hypothetical protein [Sedimentibacter sp.]